MYLHDNNLRCACVCSSCCTLSRVLQREKSTIHYDYLRDLVELTDGVSVRVQTQSWLEYLRTGIENAALLHHCCILLAVVLTASVLLKQQGRLLALPSVVFRVEFVLGAIPAQAALYCDHAN